MKAKEIGGTFFSIWSDLTAARVWQYQELPPARLLQLMKLNWRAVDDSERARALWFWLRRPTLTLCESGTALALDLLSGLLCLFITLVGSPLTPISELAIASIILFFGLGIAVVAIMRKVRLVRWKREYEVSVDRVIRTIYRGV